MPWGKTDTWKAVNRGLKYLIRHHHSQLNRAVESAWNIQRRLVSVYSFLDDLCKVTCPWCPEPCCLGAKVWIDFKDLLFCHLCGHRVPYAQLLSDVNETCRFWSWKGCTLPRITRPWVCTWYLCPTQKMNLRRESQSVQDKFNHDIEMIKADRKEMETEFVRIVS